jgi:hypothetical protein
MAATLDDLHYVAVALRVDIRGGLDKIIDNLEHPKSSGPANPGGGGPKPGGAGAGDWLDQIWAWVQKVASQHGMVQDAFRSIYDSMTTIASPVTNAVSILGKMQSATVSTFSKLGSSAAQASQVLSSFGDTFQKVITSLGGGMAKFVQLANPAAVYQFNIAVENAMSALGRVFAPILERVAGMIQMLGNAIESLSPQAKRLIAGLSMGAGLAGAFAAVAAAISAAVAALGGPVTLIITLAAAILGVAAASADGKKLMAEFGKILQLLGSAFEEMAAEVLPIIEELMPSVMEVLGSLLKAYTAVNGIIISVLAVAIKAVLVPVLEALAIVVTEVANAIVKSVNWIRKQLGLESKAPAYDPNKNTAIAARQAQFGDIRGFASRAYTSIYNTSAGGADTQLSESRRQTGFLGEIAANTRRDGSSPPETTRRTVDAPFMPPREGTGWRALV